MKDTLFDLKKRIFVITGAAGYLGVKHVEAILEANGQVALFDVNPDVVKIAKDLSQKTGETCVGFVVDVTKENQIIRGLREVQRKMGPVYGLINNAAHNAKMGEKKVKTISSRFENFSLEHWEEDLSVNLTGAFLMSKIVGRELAKRKKGVIVNIASDLSVIAPDQRIYRKSGEMENSEVKPVTYSVAKHALIGLTRYLSTYWADKGIRVNALSPGGIYNKNIDPKFVKKLTNLIPMARMAKQDEYKGAIAFLCSDASSYMTGNNLVIDGGRSVW